MERKTLSTFASISVLVIFLSSCNGFPREAALTATSIVYALAEGNVAKAHEDFDETAGSTTTADDLASIWKDVINDKGEFVKIETIETHSDLGITAVQLECVFEKGRASFVVTIFDPNNVVSILKL